MSTLTRILYVEDSPDIQVIAKMALEHIGGFEVLMCSSGAEALAQASDFNPDLIVLDVMMPEMTGPETLTALRQAACPNQPAIFVTAKASDDDIAEYYQAGAAAVIAKPFDPVNLATEVAQIYRQQVGG